MLTSLVVALSATVLALGLVVWSGYRRRRRLHYASIVALLVLLATAIGLAERYGTQLVFQGTAATVRSIHFVAVTITFALLPLVVFTGVRLARAPTGTDSDRRATHSKVAALFVVCVVVTFGLGLTMTLLADKA